MKKLISITALLLSSVFISNGQWTYTNLSEPKAFMGVTAHGTKAYFGGGWNGNNVSLVEIYDVVTEEWDTSYNHNLSVARLVPGGVTCGDLVIFAGGANSNWVMYPVVDIFNTQTMQWTDVQLSVARVGVAVASKDSIVIFAGGMIAQPWVTVDVVDIYNTETGEWSIDTLSESRDARAAAVVGDLALFAGGYNGQVLSKRVDIYNFTTNTWSIDSLSVARSWMQAVSIGNKILFAGGMTSSNVASKKVDIYDATNGTWSIDSLSFPRAFANNTAGAAACGKAFFVGGGSVNLSNLSWTTEYDVIDIYDEATNTWSIDSLSNAITEHAVVAVEDKLIVAGGRDDSDGLVSIVSIYTCPTTSCLPEGITFTTQAQIDSFQINYPGCTEIEGSVTISGNDITNLEGLDVLTSMGSLLVSNNTLLTNLSGLDNLSYVGGSITIISNDALISLVGLENLSYLEAGLFIGYYNEGNPSLTSLNGLDNVTAIAGALVITDNYSLTDLSGLDNLSYINYILSIEDNFSLTSLTGLDNLTSIGGEVAISNNPSLASLSGLDNLASIDGYLSVSNNIGLEDIIGIENIDANTITDLSIVNNHSLSDCDVQSICDYLIAPNGTIEIYENAPGCNSPEEVEEACAQSVNEISNINNLSIYPNPFSNSITIEFELKQPATVSIIIYNYLGEQIEVIPSRKSVGQQKIEWDCEGLAPGIYFCVSKTNNGMQTRKIVKL